LLLPRPNPKPEDLLLSVVRDCLFSIFADTLHPQVEDARCCGDRDQHIVTQTPTQNTIAQNKRNFNIPATCFGQSGPSSART